MRKNKIGPFKDFHQFRELVTTTMVKTLNKKEKELLDQVIYEAGDHDYEGGEVFSAIWELWREVEYFAENLPENKKRQESEIKKLQEKLKNSKSAKEKEKTRNLIARTLKWIKEEENLEDILFTGAFHDMYCGMIDGVTNPMNYEPGYSNPLMGSRKFNLMAMIDRHPKRAQSPGEKEEENISDVDLLKHWADWLSALKKEQKRKYKQVRPELTDEFFYAQHIKNRASFLRWLKTAKSGEYQLALRLRPGNWDHLFVCGDDVIECGFLIRGDKVIECGFYGRLPKSAERYSHEEFVKLYSSDFPLRIQQKQKLLAKERAAQTQARNEFRSWFDNMAERKWEKARTKIIYELCHKLGVALEKAVIKL